MEDLFEERMKTYSDMSGCFKISDKKINKINSMTSRMDKRTRIGNKLIVFNLFVLVVTLIVTPITAYAGYKVSESFYKKVENSHYTQEEKDALYKELIEDGFSDEEIENFPALNINDNNQVYGVDAFGAELIAVVSDQGESGYVYRTDLDGPNYKTPEEAVANSGEKRVLKVYKEDGKTVIGTFTLGGYGAEEEEYSEYHR